MGIVKDYERMCSDIGKSLKGFLRSCPSDVSLLVEGTKLPVHKFVLSARSKYFDNLFSIEECSQDTEADSGDAKKGSRDSKKASSDSKKASRDAKNGSGDAKKGSGQTEEGSQAIIELCDVSSLQSLVEIQDSIVPLTDNVIEIRNVKMEVVKGVLVYFYEGHYDCHEDVETHLLALELAHQFSLEGLEKILIDHLVKSFTLENFVKICRPETPTRNINLEKACIDFFKDNVEKIIANKNFSKLSSVETHLLALELAHQFSLDGLEKILIDNLVKSFTLKNFVKICRPETPNRKINLEKACIDFFKDNVEKIITNDNFSKLSSKDINLQDLELARQFNLKSLEEILIDHLVKSISMRNFTDFFNLNTSYKNGKLESTCNDFLEENCEEIAASDHFPKLTLVSLLSLLDSESFGAVEIDIFCAAEKWAGVNKPSEETVKDIVKKIRLGTISLKDLFHVVKCSKELPSIDILDAIQSTVDKDAASTNFRRRQQGRVTSPNKALVSRGATVTGGRDDRMDCIDGNENSCAFVFEDSPLTITLGHPYWLSSLRVKMDANGNNYTIESSSDGKSWQPVGDVTKGEWGAVWRTFEFSRRVVLHFRVSKKRINCLGIFLYHFESPVSTTAVTN